LPIRLQDLATEWKKTAPKGVTFAVDFVWDCILVVKDMRVIGYIYRRDVDDNMHTKRLAEILTPQEKNP
jgi:hypothetical protein